MRGQGSAAQLSPREREVARLIAQGLTNKEIAARLAISERTVATHVQNTFNKLDVGNRAQIATWWATSAPLSESISRMDVAAVPAAKSPGAPRFAGVHSLAAVALCLAAALVVATTDTGGPPLTAVARPVGVGQLVYEAKLAGDGEGFGTRYVIGDMSASAIRFRPGVVEFAVLKPDGNTGNNVAVAPLPRYYAELELSVVPGSNVEFWLDLDTNGYTVNVGDHLVDFETAAELMQMQYLVMGAGGQALGPQIAVSGMQSGRKFRLAAIANPPVYEVYLDGVRVVTMRHAPSALSLSPSFAIFGQGGTVLLTAMRVYRLGT